MQSWSNRSLRVATAALIAILAAWMNMPASAQIVTERNDTIDLTDSLRRDFDSRPYFSLYKDNYFLVGTTPFRKPTADNSDVKFQISIQQRLTKSVLPFHSYLFLAYTQRVFWDVFKRSMPMHDFIFNPGIGLTKPLFSKNRFIGKLTLLIEHESNGRDSIQSRSWNRISLGCNVIIDKWLMIHGKIWVPIIDGENNRDILKYSGIFQHGIQVTTPDKKFFWDITLTRRATWKPNYNTSFGFGWRMWNKANQYFFVQYYNGYGESLLDYNKFHSMFRVGIIIRPPYFSDF